MLDAEAIRLRDGQPTVPSLIEPCIVGRQIMTAKKQKGGKSSPSGRSRQAAEVPGPPGPAAPPTRGRQQQDVVDHGLDERELARKNLKPRSARETVKPPNDRKASTSRKGGKRTSK